MISSLNIIIATGFLAILYSFIVSKQILSANPGNAKMQEIASAIQEGARAYLNRQYKTIGVVGIAILVIITYALGFWVGLGYFIGAFLSGAAGYIGMLVSVQANVRTAEASRKSLGAGLNVSFKSGAVTGLLVAGLALLAIAIYYLILLKLMKHQNLMQLKHLQSVFLQFRTIIISNNKLQLLKVPNQQPTYL